MTTANTNSMMSGYLSEGHLEAPYASIPNPNLERSKLMRKSFHSSNRQLTALSKVPPPPPLRKTSALTQGPAPHPPQPPQIQQQLPAPAFYSTSELTSENVKSIQPFHQANVSNISTMSSNTSMSEDSCQTVITTCAVVHHEQSPPKTGPTENGVDEVDSRFLLDLPPYPSPPNSSCHSRQASEEFPPPPPSIDLEPLNEQINQLHLLDSQRQNLNLESNESGNAILHQLQQQKQQHLQQNRNSMANWLRELQSKPAGFRGLKRDISAPNIAVNQDNLLNVRDLASRFENHPTHTVQMNPNPGARTSLKPFPSQELLSNDDGPSNNSDTISLSSISSSSSSNRMPPTEKLNEISVDTVDCPMVMSKVQKHDTYLAKPRYDIAQSQIAEELREVEMLNTLVQQTLNNGSNNNLIEKRTKKKSVSFCDHVILVATADEDEEDTFIPNPILERVLRSSNENEAASSSAGKEVTKVQTVESSGDVVDGPLAKSYSNNDVINISQRNNNVMTMMNQEAKSNYFSMDPQKALQMKQQLHNTFNSQTVEMQRQLLLQQQENQKLSAILMHEQRQSQQHAELKRMGGNSNQPFQMRNPPYNPNTEMGRKMLSPPLMNQQQPQAPIPQQSMITQELASPYMSVPQPSNLQHLQHRMLMANNQVNNLRQAIQHSPVNVPTHPNMISNQSTSIYQKPPQMMMQNNNANNYNPSPYQQIPMPNPELLNQQSMVYMSPPQMAMMRQQQPPPQHHSPVLQHPQQQMMGYPQMNPNQKKVSFDIGTKTPADMLLKPGMKPGLSPDLSSATIPTRISAYNSTAIVKASAKAVQCSLCRKKYVISPAIYCTDCDFYLSRFQGNSSPHPIMASASASSIPNSANTASIRR